MVSINSAVLSLIADTLWFLSIQQFCRRLQIQCGFHRFSSFIVNCRYNMVSIHSAVLSLVSDTIMVSINSAVLSLISDTIWFPSIQQFCRRLQIQYGFHQLSSFVVNCRYKMVSINSAALSLIADTIWFPLIQQLCR